MRIRLVPAALALSLGLAACEVEQVNRVLGPQPYGADLEQTRSAAIIAEWEQTGVSTPAKDFFWLFPVLYAYTEGVDIDERVDQEGRMHAYIRASRWFSVVLGALFDRTESSVWDEDGTLLLHWGEQSILTPVIYHERWYDVRPYDLIRRTRRSFDLLLGLVGFGRDEQNHVHIRLFGLRFRA